MAVALFRGHLELATARTCDANGERGRARELRRHVATRVAGVDARYPYDDVRLARRMLERALAVAAACAKNLIIGPGAAWFRLPSGQRVELGRHRPHQRILLAMAEGHAARPGERLSLDELTAVGWPGERARATSTIARLRVAVSKLRALGLREWIVSQ